MNPQIMNKPNCHSVQCVQGLFAIEKYLSNVRIFRHFDKHICKETGTKSTYGCLAMDKAKIVLYAWGLLFLIQGHDFKHLVRNSEHKVKKLPKFGTLTSTKCVHRCKHQLFLEKAGKK